MRVKKKLYGTCKIVYSSYRSCKNVNIQTVLLWDDSRMEIEEDKKKTEKRNRLQGLMGAFGKLLQGLHVNK